MLEYAAVAEVPPLQALAPVTALMMDVSNGGVAQLAFADRLHAAYPDVPIIVSTPFVSLLLENEIRARTYATLLRKPIDYGALYALLAARDGSAAH